MKVLFLVALFIGCSFATLIHPGHVRASLGLGLGGGVSNDIKQNSQSK